MHTYLNTLTYTHMHTHVYKHTHIHLKQHIKTNKQPSLKRKSGEEIHFLKKVKSFSLQIVANIKKNGIETRKI